MIVDRLDDRGVKLIETNGNANPPSLAAWTDLVNSRTWDLIIDVGANYGEMLIGGDLGRHGLVVAVEPNPHVCHYLMQTVALNQLPVQVLCAALGSAPEFMELDISDGSSGVAALRLIDDSDVKSGARLLAPVLRLDDLVDSLHIPLESSSVLIKIDVEGHEPQVLSGSRRVLSSAHHVSVMSEVLHNHFVPEGFEVVREIFSSYEPDRVQDVVFNRRVP